MLVAFAMGCTDHAAPTADTDRSALVAEDPARDEIVATIDDRPIHAADVAAQAKASGVGAKQALDELIDAEVLAAVAFDRGLFFDSDVVVARKAAEARRLLETDFEVNVTIDKVPEAEQRKAYEKNKLLYDHPDAVEAWHIVASGPSAKPELHQKAKEMILTIEAAAKAADSDQAFAKLADTPSPAVPLKAEQLTFPKRGIVEDSFADAAFKLGSPGDTSPVTETSYGFHLIRLVRKLPERHVPLDAVRPELRTLVFPSWRKSELDRFVRGLAAQASVQVFPERLVAAEGQAAHP